MRLVDLSAPISQSPPETPDVLRTDIEYAEPRRRAPRRSRRCWACRRACCATARAGRSRRSPRFGTHNATHVDAPWHYNSRIQGERAQTIDELPLDWFLGPGVVLDMTAKADGDAVTVAEVEAELERVGHELRERDIVLVRTGRDAVHRRARLHRAGARA